ncbi:MAG: sugar-transfer associated ATP-grasp domain-containing protein [Candidatus Moranbacteria bacterium]|nr:sugar-transfer associated ATP-grasp domain-containing protein [Candidatus Moranbacteria bacterium]
MNSRNLRFMRPYNLKKAKRLADDKLKSKAILKKNEIPVPKLLAKIKTRQELEAFDFSSLPNSFVLKPTSGLGGEGILVVYGRKKGEQNTWVKADRSFVTEEDLKNQIQNILDGSFSRINTPGVAFFEERIKLSKNFKPYSYKGVPDIRVIVYNGVPVMAMLRLATKESSGKANLQLGGIGCGVDMATGTTTSAVQGKSKSLEYLPGTRLPLSGIKIPYWDEILKLSVEAQKATNLGFLGADVAIDRERGPVFLELNARPGLSIQIANLEGLLGRLQRVEGLKVKSLKHGIKIAKNLFGGEIEEEMEELSGKKVISTVEKIKLFGKNEEEIEVEAKIDTGAYSTSIDTDLAKKLGFEELIQAFEKIEIPEDFSRDNIKEIEEELRKKHLKKIDNLADISAVYSSSGVTIRPKVKVKFIMDEEEISTNVNIVKRDEMKYQVLIGRKNLKKFLVEIK